MTKIQPHIITTRPLSNEAEETCAQHEVKLSTFSFIDIIPTESEEVKNKILNLAVNDIHKTLLFTSMNAVEIVSKWLEIHQVPSPKWDIFSLTGTTSKLIKKYFPKATLRGTAPNAEQLITILKNNISPHTESIHFPAGNIRRDTLPNFIESWIYPYEFYTVYETKMTPIVVEESYNSVLFFSPSSVESFFKVNPSKKGVRYFAIGKSTGEALGRWALPEDIKIFEGLPSKEGLLYYALEEFK